MSSIKKRWLVLRSSARGTGPGIDWFDSKKDAYEHAGKLAGRQPGERFNILEIVGTVIVPLPDYVFETVE